MAISLVFVERLVYFADQRLSKIKAVALPEEVAHLCHIMP
jgi:hypothetical protein